jgi:hypothetical protein
MVGVDLQADTLAMRLEIDGSTMRSRRSAATRSEGRERTILKSTIGRLGIGCPK